MSTSSFPGLLLIASASFFLVSYGDEIVDLGKDLETVRNVGGEGE